MADRFGYEPVTCMLFGSSVLVGIGFPFGTKALNIPDRPDHALEFSPQPGCIVSIPEILHDGVDKFSMTVVFVRRICPATIDDAWNLPIRVLIPRIPIEVFPD